MYYELVMFVIRNLRIAFNTDMFVIFLTERTKWYWTTHKNVYSTVGLTVARFKQILQSYFCCVVVNYSVYYYNSH